MSQPLLLAAGTRGLDLLLRSLLENRVRELRYYPSTRDNAAAFGPWLLIVDRLDRLIRFIRDYSSITFHAPVHAPVSQVFFFNLACSCLFPMHCASL